MSRLRVGVVGSGALGRHHARIYSELHAAGLVEMTGIYDANTASARAVAFRPSPTGHAAELFWWVVEKAYESRKCACRAPWW